MSVLEKQAGLGFGQADQIRLLLLDQFRKQEPPFRSGDSPLGIPDDSFHIR